MFPTTLTLICNPAEPVLTNALLERCEDALGAFVPAGAERRVLADGVAADYAFATDREYRDVVAATTTAIAGAPVDIAVQATGTREKKLLIADMDSTIIEQECIDELAEFVGKRSEISAITERAMRGELDFEGALRERVAMLEGLTTEHLQDAFRERITLTPGARTLVRTMRARGAFTALVSGGFTFFTARVADAAGFHVNEANTLLMDDDRLTGRVGEPILGRAAKEAALLRHCGEQLVPTSAALAVGDGANDLAMLGAAGTGVAFRAKPAVAEAADISIRHGDLTALLYLQGIPQTEFTE